MIELNEAWGWPRWRTGSSRIVGWALLLGGAALALHCSGFLSRIGGGTPVPVQPTQHLVTTGLYGYSRNPIYVADFGILVGLFLVRGELALLLYAALFAALLQAWIVLREEPELRRRFGEEYVRYAERVPRWIPPRLRRARG